MVICKPTIGQWYVDRSGGVFEVVAVDKESNAIDIQFVDSTVDELDYERWARSTVEEIDTPNDCLVSETQSETSDSLLNDFVPRSDWLATFDFMDIEYVEMDLYDENGGHI